MVVQSVIDLLTPDWPEEMKDKIRAKWYRNMSKRPSAAL
jgi:hypothetical protein